MLIMPIVHSFFESLLTNAIISRQIDSNAAAVLDCSNWASWIIYACVKSPALKDVMLEFAVNGECGDGSSFEARLVEPSDEIEAAEQKQKATASDQNISLIRERASFKYPYTEQTAIASKFSVSEISKSSGDVYDFDSTPDFMLSDSMTGAQRGTALHTFMQFANYQNARQNVAAELEQVENLGHITSRQRSVIDEKKLEAFFSSKLCDRILNSNAVLREYKFMTGIDSAQFGGAESAGDTVILQGVADCVIIEGGEATIIDYKTDYVKAESELIERYAMQLALYKNAITKLLDMPIKECLIYSFCLGKEISVNTDNTL